MKELCLIVWILASLVLVFSVIGMLLFIPKVDSYTHGASTVQRSGWVEIGVTLMKKIVE